MYPWLKFLHLVSVVLFLGNIITGLFWHHHAARTRDAKLLAHAMDGIIRADRLFTLPGVAGIAVAGVAMALRLNLPMLRTGWIGGTLALFALSGLMFAWRVAPLQRELLAFARAGERAGVFDYPGYRALALRWEWWGAAALLTPLLGMALMVLKPA